MYYLSKHVQEAEVSDALVELVSGNLPLFETINDAVKEGTVIDPMNTSSHDVWQEFFAIVYMLADMRDRKANEGDADG